MTTVTAGPERPQMHIVVAMTGEAIRGLPHLMHRGGVAPRADQLGVRPFQFEISLLVVIEDPRRPRIGVVATAAVPPERALMLIGIGVTFHARQRRILEGARDMAGFARDQCVLANQREGAEVVLEPHLSHPALLAVTVLAASALLPLVHVVAAMTVVTSRRQALLFGRDAVALVADQLPVPAAQCESRILRVIEAGLLPITRHVTIRALRASAAFVHIVDRMAGTAFTFVLLLFRSPFVASYAQQLGVFAVEFELGLLVVIEAAFFPAPFTVARFTLVTVSSLVPVVVAMTRYALLLQLVLVQVARVTCRTARLFMRPPQRKLGCLVMVEFELCPFFRQVAIGAFLPILPIVHVIEPVTIHALAGNVLVAVIHMAKQTCRGTVLAE